MMWGNFFGNRGMVAYGQPAAFSIVYSTPVVLLCVLIVREIYRPSTDLVRLAGDDDPCGGVLDDAPDVLRLPGLRGRAHV